MWPSCVRDTIASQFNTGLFHGAIYVYTFNAHGVSKVLFKIKN